MNIIVFGASQVYGACDYRHGGWVGLLKSYIEKKSDFMDSVFNLGVSAQTSCDVAGRMEPELVPRLEKGSKNIVIISVGINDSSYLIGHKKTRVSEKIYRANVRRLARLAKRYSRNVFFIGLIPVDESRTKPIEWDRTRCYSNANVSRFNDAMKDVCSREKVQFIDLFAYMSKMNYAKLLEDGLHPSSKGHNVVFRHVLASLRSSSALD